MKKERFGLIILLLIAAFILIFGSFMSKAALIITGFPAVIIYVSGVRRWKSYNWMGI